MAYDASGLAKLAHASDGPGLWSYKTADAAAAVDTEGYFNDASDMLKVGDLIISNCNDVGGLHQVASNSGGVVDVADAVATGTTDTD